MTPRINKFALGGLILIALSGCTPTVQPEAVSVDWTKLQAPTVAPVESFAPAVSGGVAGSAMTVPAVAVKTVNPNSLATAWTKTAQDELKRSQDDVDAQISAPLATVRERQEAFMGGKIQDLVIRQQGERNKVLDEFYDALLTHAEDVGWKRTTLDWMVGFPDPDPLSQHRPHNSDIFGRRINDQAVSLRNEVKVSDALFDASWKSRVALEDNNFKDQVDQLRATLLKQADAELATERTKLVAAAVQAGSAGARHPNPGLSLPVADSGLVTGRVEALSVQLPAAEVSVSSTPAWVLQHRMDIYLGTHNLRLAAPGEKGRDITPEFSRWLQQFEPGR